MEDIITREIRQIVREELKAAHRHTEQSQQSQQRPVLLTEEETSEWLGVPIGTLRDWRQKRINLPFIPLSDRKSRYDEKAVTDFLRSIEVQIGE